MSKKKLNERLIASNKRARHDYFLQDYLEAGMVLEGWEVKSIRAGRVQLNESYILLKQGEAWLIGAHISALSTASTHINPDPLRTRKLLLNKKELSKLFIQVKRQGYTIVPVDMHWCRNRVKVEIALAKGKHNHDKRQAQKQKEWDREKQRLLKS